MRLLPAGLLEPLGHLHFSKIGNWADEGAGIDTMADERPPFHECEG
jgi:hypothetical protein